MQTPRTPSPSLCIAGAQALREVAKRVEVLDKFVSETSIELQDQERKADATQSIIDQVGFRV